jgi:hypothetical protein
LGAGAFYAIYYNKNRNASQVSWDMDFAVPETDNIYKIFLADHSGKTINLDRREDGRWLCNGKYPVRPSALDNLFQSIRQQTVYYIPPDAAVKNIVNSLASEGIKVELYDKKGKKLKVYYVGGVTNDERGTYMIMEGAEQPYIVHVPSFIGQLRVNYMMNEIDWRDRTVFAEKPEHIQFVSVEYPQQRSESFKLEKTGEASYVVSPFHSTTPVSKNPQRKGAAEAYLIQFESLGVEAFENQNALRDSVRSLIPFAIVTLKRADGTEKLVRFWPLEFETRSETGQQSVNRYFAATGDDFLLVQERVFGPIFRGYGFFFESGRMRN